MCFTSLPSQSTLPWADCPLNSNRTGPLEECETATSTKYFFYRETLNISSSIEERGSIQWSQALCLLLAWAITYLLVSKGIKSTGKVRELCIPMLWNVHTKTGLRFEIPSFWSRLPRETYSLKSDNKDVTVNSLNYIISIIFVTTTI